jgi:hypothetical protein
LEIRFLDTTIEQFNQLVKEEEKVKVTISCYKTDHYNDGTSEVVLTSAYTREIRSIKDIFQFDYDKDMKVLTRVQRDTSFCSTAMGTFKSL